MCICLVIRSTRSAEIEYALVNSFQCSDSWARLLFPSVFHGSLLPIMPWLCCVLGRVELLFKHLKTFVSVISFAVNGRQKVLQCQTCKTAILQWYYFTLPDFLFSIIVQKCDMRTVEQDIALHGSAVFCRLLGKRCYCCSVSRIAGLLHLGIWTYPSKFRSTWLSLCSGFSVGLSSNSWYLRMASVWSD